MIEYIMVNTDNVEITKHPKTIETQQKKHSHKYVESA